MAFTYLIGWSRLNAWYYGVSFAKKRQPRDLWRTYFTSSNYVKQFRNEHGEPDVIQIRRLFDDKESAIQWETRVLKRLKVIKESKWLNRTDNQAIRNGSRRVYRTPWNKGKKVPGPSAASKEKRRVTITGVKRGRYKVRHNRRIEFRGKIYQSFDAARTDTGASFYTIRRYALVQEPLPSPAA